MPKKILLTLAIIAAISSAGIFYVNKILLPVQVKAMVQKAAREALNRNVTFDSLQYNMLSGLVVKNLTIFSRENPDEIFIHIDSASAQVFFPGLLQKKIILPSVRVDNLSARVVRQNAGTWNFSDLLAPQPKPLPVTGAADPAGTKAVAPMEFIISGLAINHARIKLADLAGGDNFSEMIEPVNIHGSLNLAGNIHLTGDIGIPSTKGSVSFNVLAGMKDGNIKADVKLENIIADKYLRFVPEGVNIPIKTLTLTKASVELHLNGRDITVSGSARLDNIAASPATDLNVHGALTLDKAVLTLNSSGLRYTGAATLHEAGVEIGADRKFSGTVKTSGTTFLLKGQDWTLTTDADLNSLTAVLGDGQKILAGVTLTRLSAAQTGKNITARTDITVRDLSAGMPGGISIKAALSAADAALAINDGALDILARPIFSRLELALPQGLGFSGSPAIDAHVSLPPAGQGELSYTASIELKDSRLSGLPVIGDITAVSGLFKIKNNDADVKRASLTILGAPVELSGTVKNFIRPELKLRAEALNVNLALIEKVLPQIIKDNALNITGKADVSAYIIGNAALLPMKGLTVTAVLKDVTVESGKLKQSLEHVSGTLVYEASTLTWKKLAIGFTGKTYTLNGYLENFVNPVIATSIKAENMNVDAQVRKSGDLLTVQSLEASWFDSSISATGKILLPAGQAPTADITLTAKTSLLDIPRMIPAQAKQFEALKLAGSLKLTARIKGNPADWQHLESTCKLEIPVLNVLGYTLNDITLDADQNNGELRPLEFKARIYDGDLSAIGSLGLVKAGFPFESSIKLENTNLELLKRDTPLKNQQLSGMISLAADLKGKALEVRSVEGRITTAIKDGYLWDIKAFSDILSKISSSFQGGGIAITEASATLDLQDGKLDTNDLLLKSSTLSLLGEGTVDLLGQTLDLNITPRLETLPGNSNTVNTMQFLNPTAGLINVHVGGTIQKPEVTHNISAPTVIKKALQNTVGDLLKLF